MSCCFIIGLYICEGQQLSDETQHRVTWFYSLKKNHQQYAIFSWMYNKTISLYDSLMQINEHDLTGIFSCKNLES